MPTQDIKMTDGRPSAPQLPPAQPAVPPTQPAIPPAQLGPT